LKDLLNAVLFNSSGFSYHTTDTKMTIVSIV